MYLGEMVFVVSHEFISTPGKPKNRPDQGRIEPTIKNQPTELHEQVGSSM